jgi:hypothetical protein
MSLPRLTAAGRVRTSLALWPVALYPRASHVVLDAYPAGLQI